MCDPLRFYLGGDIQRNVGKGSLQLELDRESELPPRQVASD